MPIEIKELIIKVQVQEGNKKSQENEIEEIKRVLLRECRKEIKLQFKKNKDK